MTPSMETWAPTIIFRTSLSLFESGLAPTFCSAAAVNALRTEHCQLPRVGALIVADEICVGVGAQEFEVPVVRRQPRVEHFRVDDATISENQHAWRLFAAVSCVALDVNAKELLLTHGS